MQIKIYKIEYFDGRKGCWQSASPQEWTDLDKVKAYKKAQQEMCDYMVQFRILEQAA
jgi:hypothetical protein